MTGFSHLNSIHLTYLGPLLKWRVMDLESLRQECFHAPEYFNFCRIIRVLEKEKILEGYRHPFNRKKYVYLSPFGESQLSIKENPSAVSKDTLIHDIKVSEITKGFIDLGWIESAELEHQLNDKRNFKVTYKIIPDALLYGKRKGINFKMALEVELTRKNNQRILEKARQYIDSNYYNYAMYFFSKRNIMEKYMAVLYDGLGDQVKSRIMFFLDETMTAKPSDLKKVEGYFKGEKVMLSQLFEQIQSV